MKKQEQLKGAEMVLENYIEGAMYDYEEGNLSKEASECLLDAIKGYARLGGWENQFIANEWLEKYNNVKNKKR